MARVNDVRGEIRDFLARQLIGPAGDPDETLPKKERPDTRYLMGMLFPQGASRDEKKQAEEEEDTVSSGDASESDDSPVALAYQQYPASFGISFLVSGSGALKVSVHGACYERRNGKWQRRAICEADRPQVVTLPPPAGGSGSRREKVLEDRAELHAVWRQDTDGLLITVSLINAQHRPGYPDPEQCLFQTGIICECTDGVFLRYAGPQRLSGDREEEELLLQYRKYAPYATGHGCAADWHTADDNSITRVYSTFLPAYEVPLVTPEPLTDEGAMVLRLRWLADQSVPAAELTTALNAFTDGYAQWLERTAQAVAELQGRQREAAERIIARLRKAEQRMRGGIRKLADPVVLRAFRLATQAMLMQMIHSGSEYGRSNRARNSRPFVQPDYTAPGLDTFRWRPFQLAFQLLTIPSVIDGKDAERETVDLLWFPTGGGKTEAYLLLAAMTIFHRRLTAKKRGGGTAVIKRYTLRLLTAQQFQRAATMICACERIRLAAPDEYGREPFTIGLWVGDDAAPNLFSNSSQGSPGALERFKAMKEQETPENRFQLLNCPWCGTRIVPAKKSSEPADYGIRADAASFSFHCPSDDCPFHGGLPVQIVDQALYQRPPSLLIGTIDKFARLAWDERGKAFFGGSTNLPPSLIIQDELHLIGGPLGTVAGIYEAAIDTMIRALGVPAKVIASTATIRRADEQVRALYGRTVDIFPPPGLDADDAWFSRTDRTRLGRLYIGAMGQAHTPVYSMVCAVTALTQAPVELALQGANRDGYWTQVVYHNSRRELGKTMTLTRDDVPNRLALTVADQARMRDPKNVVELSANVASARIPNILEELQRHADERGVIDILPCTNMLSVGVDVSRLALMLVNGQPKSTSEYIQATSRIGRSQVPGVVLTLFSGTKPRDRSHYESFTAWHRTLYRTVEPVSATPFAPPARDRALHAALVILVRHAGGCGDNAAAGQFDSEEPRLAELLRQFKARIAVADPREATAAAEHLDRLIARWQREVREKTNLLYDAGSAGQQFKSLLCTFDRKGAGIWPTLNSMRKVDTECLIGVIEEENV